MSHDVSLEANMGNGMVCVGNLDAKVTYNLSPMFREACGSSPADWKGRGALEVAFLCDKIVRELESKAQKYDALAPANGWGSRENAIEFARSVMSACLAAPNARVRVA